MHQIFYTLQNTGNTPWHRTKAACAVYLMHGRRAGAAVSVRQTHSRCGEAAFFFFTGSSRWSVAMATASLPLASASLSLPHSLTHSHVDKVSYCSCAFPLPTSFPSSPTLAAYLKLISLAASGGAPRRLPSARACLALGEMKTDSHWHRGRRDADALMCPPTPT